MMLRSKAFSDQAMIPAQHAREHANVSPPLEWDRAPEGTAELVLLCEDPDAPGRPFVHWVVTGIPPQCTGMEEGEFVRGAHVGHNGFGGQGWGGPHPPAGDEPHRYFFRLYAVDQPLEVDPDAGADRIHAALEGHTLEEATLVGRYGR